MLMDPIADRHAPSGDGYSVKREVKECLECDVCGARCPMEE